MLDFIIDSAHIFYGIPFLVLSVLSTLAFVFFMVLPVKALLENHPNLQNIDTNNFMFKTYVGLPIAVIFIMTFGMTVLAFLNVVQNIIGIRIIP